MHNALKAKNSELPWKEICCFALINIMEPRLKLFGDSIWSGFAGETDIDDPLPLITISILAESSFVSDNSVMDLVWKIHIISKRVF